MGVWCDTLLDSRISAGVGAMAGLTRASCTSLKVCPEPMGRAWAAGETIPAAGDPVGVAVVRYRTPVANQCSSVSGQFIRNDAKTSHLP